MGYFSNGTEGSLFEARYCARCVHSDCCPIWPLHLAWNYEQKDADEGGTPEQHAKGLALSSLITRIGIENKCTMFYPRPVPTLPTDETRQVVTIKAPKGEYHVDACVYDDFAVHRPIDRSSEGEADAFVVTHLPSNHAVLWGMRLDKAIELAQRLTTLDVDTSFTNVTLKDATYKRFVDAVGPIVKEYR